MRDDKGRFIKTHGGKGTRLYSVWCAMKERCNNHHNKRYSIYGARGIKVCDSWSNSFEEFKSWALKSGYKEGLTIDRKNFNGNYEPDNCRWVTTKEQNRNYSRNKFIIYHDKKMCLKEYSEITGINYGTVLWRYNNGKMEDMKEGV